MTLTDIFLKVQAMKIRILFVMILGCVFLGAGNAQDIQEKRPINLNGIWQMCFYCSPSPDMPGELRAGHSLKILSDNGRFCNLVMTPAGAVIIGCGTFRLVSSSFYTETVEENVHLPQLKGKENKLYFEMEDGGKLMKVKYFVETDAEGNKIDAWYHEVWKRVEAASSYPGDMLR